MRIAIYSRKSISTTRGESIDNQIEMCKQYIFSKLNNIAEEDITIYEDEGFSAKNFDRPQLQKLIQDIKQKQFDYIVCYRLDRISRNIGDFATLIEDFNARNISFICIKEEFDTSKPMGKAMMYITSVFAQLERETIAERVKDNMHMLARTGRWLGGTTPLGYSSEKVENVLIDGRLRTSYKLKFNSTEIEIANTIFKEFLNTHSISAVSKYLSNHNIKSRTGKTYSLLGVKQILQNPVYSIADKDLRDYFTSHNSEICFTEQECSTTLGAISYNKRNYKKKHAPRLNKSEWIVAIGHHKGIITGKQWVEVQNILESNKPSNPNPKSHNSYSLLSGVIYCKYCNSKMFAKRRNNNKKVFDYICNNKLHGGTKLCNSPNLNGVYIDDIVCNELMKFMNHNSKICTSLQNMKKKLQEQSNADPIHKIEIEINQLNMEIDNLVNTISQNTLESISPALLRRINSKMSELDGKINNLTKEKLRLQSISENTTEELLNILACTLSTLESSFKKFKLVEKRTLISLLIKKIEWDGRNVNIFIYTV